MKNESVVLETPDDVMRVLVARYEYHRSFRPDEVQALLMFRDGNNSAHAEQATQLLVKSGYLNA